MNTNIHKVHKSKKKYIVKYIVRMQKKNIKRSKRNSIVSKWLVESVSLVYSQEIKNKDIVRI